VTAKKLIAYAGGPESVFSIKKKELLQIPGISEKTAAKIIESQSLHDAEIHAKWCERHHVRVISYWENDFPQRLKHCEDSPVTLFFKGHGELNPPRTLAIVGTRNITHYGKAITEEIIEGLKPHNPQIISGLAYGVDIHAHRQSLRFGLSTVGVLGNGPDKVYPALHRSVAEEMEAKGGILTEFVPGTPPDKENFPTRNRVVAGMADATLVIESDVKGGSIITATLAHSYDREVLAVPGRVDEKYSSGCNKLIFEQKAQMVRCAADIAHHLQWDLEGKKKIIQPSLFLELSPDEQTLTDYLRHRGRMPIDLISNDTRLAVSTCASLLLELEFKGAVRSLPGKMYEAC
jgi:DNA processing protein